MSAPWPDHLLTLDEWDELDEDVSRCFELVDGVLQMSPRPTPRHQVALMRLAMQLNPQLSPLGLECVPEVDVVLVETFPPVVRAPDLCVVSAEVLRSGPARLRPEEIVLVVEILSPGSMRTDRVSKLSDYALARIQNYWILDVASTPRLDAFRLTGSGYEPFASGEGGSFAVAEPAAMVIDLDGLSS